MFAFSAFVVYSRNIEKSKKKSNRKLHVNRISLIQVPAEIHNPWFNIIWLFSN